MTVALNRVIYIQSVLTRLKMLGELIERSQIAANTSSHWPSRAAFQGVDLEGRGWDYFSIKYN